MPFNNIESQSLRQGRTYKRPRISISEHWSKLKHFGLSVKSELIVFCRVHTGFDEDSFHCFPIVVMISSRHAMNFPLASNGVAILFPSYRKEHLSPHVLEAHRVLPLPVSPTALHNPYIEVISFAIITKGTYFLLETQTSWSENVSKHLQCTQKYQPQSQQSIKARRRKKKHCCIVLPTVIKSRSSNFPPLQSEQSANKLQHIIQAKSDNKPQYTLQMKWKGTWAEIRTILLRKKFKRNNTNADADFLHSKKFVTLGISFVVRPPKHFRTVFPVIMVQN